MQVVSDPPSLGRTAHHGEKGQGNLVWITQNRWVGDGGRDGGGMCDQHNATAWREDKVPWGVQSSAKLDAQLLNQKDN